MSLHVHSLGIDHLVQQGLPPVITVPSGFQCTPTTNSKIGLGGKQLFRKLWRKKLQRSCSTERQSVHSVTVESGLCVICCLCTLGMSYLKLVLHRRGHSHFAAVGSEGAGQQHIHHGPYTASGTSFSIVVSGRIK